MTEINGLICYRNHPIIISKINKYVDENSSVKMIPIFELNSYKNDSHIFDTIDKHKNRR